jgi:hypothetical protein
MAKVRTGPDCASIGLAQDAFAGVKHSPAFSGLAQRRIAGVLFAKRRPAGELLMTAPYARQPEVLPRPAWTPTATRAVLAANADGDILRRYDEDLDAAFEQAREQGDVTPLVQTVKRWWFEADAWRNPQAQREFLARIDTYRGEDLPPAEQRMSREEIRTQFDV